MKLVKPSEEYIDSYYKGCRESKGHLHDNYILHDPDKYDSWKNTIIKDYENSEKGVGLPEGFVPNVTYWVIENDKYIGSVNIRLSLNKKLIEYGGSCGVALIPGVRGKGLGVELAKLAFEKMKELNISPVLLSCEEKNAASWHILEKFHYTKKDLYQTMIKGELTCARRYWYNFAEGY